MTEQTQLWRKEAHHFVIEIKVGNAWVEQGRAMTEEEALFQGNKALKDPSVLAARVLLNEKTQVCSLMWEEKADVVMHVPPKMTKTDRKASCPVCYVLAPIATDGTTEWVFCAKCDRANPA